MESFNPGRLMNNELDHFFSSLEFKISNNKTRNGEQIPFEMLAVAIKEKRITELKYWLLFHNLGLVDTDTGLTILHVAIYWRDATILQLLLDNNLCKELINIADKTGLTPLICAVQYGSLHMVVTLCSYGANTCNVIYKTGDTALHYAVKSSDVSLVTCLLNYDSSQEFVDATNFKGDTALIAAARRNSLAVQPLLLARADYMKGNVCTGRTILHETVAFAHEILVKEITERCPSPMFTELRDNRGDTALMIAVRLNNLNLVKLLLEKQKYRLVINRKTEESILHMAVMNDKYQILKHLLDNTDSNLLKHSNREGQTPLLLAGEQNSLKCLKLLITKGHIKTRNCYTGETLLHSAINSNNALLLSELTTLDSLYWFLKEKDYEGKTPFWSAIEGENHLGLVSFRVSGWSEINKLNKNGESCVFVSAKFGFIKILKALLLSDKYYSFCKDHPVFTNITNIKELNDAEIRGDIYSTDLFVLFGKSPTANAHNWIPNCLFTHDKNGRNIFHACALGGKIDCLKFMFTYFKTLKLNLKLFDEKSNNGDTPLMLATESGSLDQKKCVIFFLENGANIASVNNNNISVLKSILLHYSRPTDLLIKVLNSFVKRNQPFETTDKESNHTVVNFSILMPVNQPQLNTIKLFDDTLKGDEKIEVMRHFLIKMFVSLKWMNVKRIFLLSFIVSCINTLLLSSYLTFLIVKPGLKFTIFFTIGKPCLVLLNLKEILLSLPFLSLNNISLFLLMIVLYIIPCLSTIFYVIFNDGSQVMQELASVCVLMSWLRLLMNSANIFTEISHQVAMLSNILLAICKHATVLLVIVFTFSLCFFCIFNDYDNFSSPLLALLYTFFVMLQGELEDSFLYFLNKHYFITNSTIITKNTLEYTLIKNVNLLIQSTILLLFVFVCVIGLLNMLVGLAVRDSTTLAADGEVFQRHLQIQLLNNLEVFFESTIFSVLERTRLIYLLGISSEMKDNCKLKLFYDSVFEQSNLRLHNDQLKDMRKSTLMITPRVYKELIALDSSTNYHSDDLVDRLVLITNNQRELNQDLTELNHRINKVNQVY